MANEITLELENVSKAFGGVSAVSGMSLQIERGTISGLIGPNGAGKSTLFNVICGGTSIDGGMINLFGRDITGWPAYKIARKGMVRTFQLARELGRLTVLENVMVAAPAPIGEKLHAVFLRPGSVRRQEAQVFARAVELLDLVGLCHVMDLRADAISGGQKKLLELARALMLDPELILLDEPGAGVNPALMDALSTAIQKIHMEMGKTFLIIEHDMSLVARLCSHVTVMASGQRLAEGTFQSVTSDPRVIDAYLGGSYAQ